MPNGGDNRENPENHFKVNFFITKFSEFHEAFPNENQNIIDHVVTQVWGSDSKPSTEHIKGKGGYESIWTFEKNGKKIIKRVFHPGGGEHFTGADFIVTKEISKREIGVTAIQVKRNRGKKSFIFNKKNLAQMRKFKDFWSSAYYLMVDETVAPPLGCFLRVNELVSLMKGSQSSKYANVSNDDVRKYCRGTNIFYEMFYACNRGSIYSIRELTKDAVDYSSEASRVLIELMVRES